MRLREWRETAGLKLDRAAVYTSDRIGMEISSEKLRRYETGWPEAKMEPAVLLGLLDVYGKALGDLPEASRERVSRLYALASGSLDELRPSGVARFSPLLPVLVGV